MNFRTKLTLTSAFALFAGPALADLTAEQVLADQVSQIEYAGMNVAVLGQSKSGDTLSVEGLVMSANVDGAIISITMPGADLTEQGDGSVAIVFPESAPVAFSFEADGETVSGQGTLGLSGASNVASGSPERIRYDFDADKITFGDLRFDSPAEMAELGMTFSLEVSELLSSMELGDGEVRDYTGDGSIGAMSVAFQMAIPDEGGVDVSFAMADLMMKYSGAFAPQDINASLAEMIASGYRSIAEVNYGEVLFAVDADTPDGAFQVNGGAGTGDLSISMDENGLDYATSNTDIAYSFASSMLPLPPLSVNMAESSGRVTMPMIPGEDPQGFAFAFNLGDVTLDDMIWGMIDPAGQLPRDPINIALDVDGVLVMLQDIFDPEIMENMTSSPGELRSANLNELRLSIAGAELTGDGAFTFNNEFGIPMPAGVANFMLTGGNTLLDTLVGMGLIPEDQAMGARMMTGLFARPGEGEDTLISTIEMKEDGSILANGQRIK